MSESIGPVTVTSKVAQFEFRSLLGSEELGQPFRYDVELLNPSSELKAETMLGSTMTIELTRRDDKPRYFHGYVTDFSLSGADVESFVYSVTLRPWLYLLSQRTHCRIFKGNAVDIVKQIADGEEYKGHSVIGEGLINKDHLHDYEFVVQFRESDFDFFMRVLERDGIYYYFEHEKDQHKLVLSNGGGYDVAGYAELLYRPPTGQSAEVQESVDAWVSHHSLTAGKITTKDFSYKAPTVPLDAKATIEPEQVIKHIEAYDYPAGYFEPGLGQAVATRRLQTLQVRGARFEGSTNVRTVGAGMMFKLKEHPVKAFNDDYLVSAAQFQIVSHAPTSRTSTASGGDIMRATLLAVQKLRPFFPIPRTPKPAMPGVQSAVVVGEPTGDEIYLDPKEYCRVKVKFPWDLDADTTGKNSCWVRVSQNWAGNGFGVQFHPRLGQEVLVAFLEGDPDRPIIVGRVYNEQNPPPYKTLTQGGIKTDSTVDKDLKSYNEIRFEDKAGSEELFVQAQKTHTVNVKGSRSVSVGGTQTTSVTGKETRKYKDARDTEVTLTDTLKVHQLRKTEFLLGRDQTVSGGVDKLEVSGQDKTTKVDKTWTIETATGFKLADNTTTKVELVGGKILISAPTEVTIKCGESTKIVLSPDSVTISAATVKLAGNTGNVLELAGEKATLTGLTETVITGPMGVKING
jgi:type VI secretion system secreted protein VgrG